ncbi:MAG: hypothetical protein WDO06_07705 [Actinomycetota bacterium]
MNFESIHYFDNRSNFSARNFSFVVVGLLFMSQLLFGFEKRFCSTMENQKLSVGECTSRSQVSRVFRFQCLLFNDFLSWGIGDDQYQGHATAQLVVWGALWIGIG